MCNVHIIRQFTVAVDPMSKEYNYAMLAHICFLLLKYFIWLEKKNGLTCENIFMQNFWLIVERYRNW